MQTPLVRFVYVNNAKSIYTQAKDGYLLGYATPGSVGLDLRACLPSSEESVSSGLMIAPNERVFVPTGIAIEPLNTDIAGFVYSRSGLGAMKGIVVAQGTGVIDPDYRGEISVVLLNTSQNPYTLQQGERIAQLVFQPALRVTLEEAEQLSTTQRGMGGFGHTDTKKLDSST